MLHRRRLAALSFSVPRHSERSAEDWWRVPHTSVLRVGLLTLTGGPDDKSKDEFGCPTRRFYVWGF